MNASKKTTSEFLSLEREQAGSGRMKLQSGFCSARGDLWGGVGLAAMLEIMADKSSKTHVVSASIQFLRNKSDAAELVVSAKEMTSTRRVSQLVGEGYLDDIHAFQVSACFGLQQDANSVAGTEPPEVPGVSECPEVDLGNPRTAIHQHTELRLASGVFGVTGQGTLNNRKSLIMWVRMPEVKTDTGAVAILSDYFLAGVGAATGEQAFGVSLDHSIRFCALPQTEWVLCEIRIDLVSRDYCAGCAHFWDASGVLFGFASQSILMRPIVSETA